MATREARFIESLKVSCYKVCAYHWLCCIVLVAVVKGGTCTRVPSFTESMKDVLLAVRRARM